MSNEEIKKYIERIKLESDFFYIDDVKYNWIECDFNDTWNLGVYMECLNLHLERKLSFTLWVRERTSNDEILSDMSKDEDLKNLFIDKVFEKLVIIVNKIKSNG